MKKLQDYINESLDKSFSGDIKKQVKTLYHKLFKANSFKKFEADTKFLKEYVSKQDVVDEITKRFDLNNKDSYVELEEYGGIMNLLDEEEYNRISVKDFVSFVKNSDDWQLFKNDDHNAWFLPALEAWSLDINELVKYEDDIVKELKEFYHRK